jgi:iron complex outermembrane receptor protein/outer membrane receptor for ferrienterochelin and colicins
MGYTLLALYSKQKPFDADKDDFTEVPKSNEFTIHPNCFFIQTKIRPFRLEIV